MALTWRYGPQARKVIANAMGARSLRLSGKRRDKLRLLVSDEDVAYDHTSVEDLVSHQDYYYNAVTKTVHQRVTSPTADQWMLV